MGENHKCKRIIYDSKHGSMRYSGGQKVGKMNGDQICHQNCLTVCDGHNTKVKRRHQQKHNTETTQTTTVITQSIPEK